MTAGTALTAGGGLAMAAASAVAGAGYALTPATGPPGARFGAFGDPWVEPGIALGGVLGAAALLVTTVWLSGRLRAGLRRGASLVANGAAVLGYVAAAKAGLWLHLRADPPLPPSWSWLQIPLVVGLLGAMVWVAGVALAVRAAPRSHRRDDRPPEAEERRGGLPPV